MKRQSAVKALGEVALRVNNLQQMKLFYQDILGLEVLSEFSTAARLTIAGDYEPEKKRLEALGLEVEVKNHDWVKRRSLYFHDPEGNLVELVCYDESLGQ